MKVLVFPHHLELGGSQTNAIELAAAVRDRHGHDVVVFATPGPAARLVADRGLRLLEAPRPEHHPSPRMALALDAAVRAERPDVLHAWDWMQVLDAYCSVHLLRRTPLVTSNMSMSVTRFLPRTVPITYGTPAMVDDARRFHGDDAHLLEPPVDTDANAPGATAGDAAADALDVEGRAVPGDHLTVGIVSRLVSWMKAEGVRRTMDAVAALDVVTDGDGRVRPLRLVVAGGGTAFDDLADHAAKHNATLGREAIVLTGPLVDPRPVYDRVDVVAGMGGSILRGMAFAKPCIVLGEEGFSQPFRPDTAAPFLHEGFFGVGGGDVDSLAAHLRALAGTTAAARDELGTWSRRVVLDRFSLHAGADRLDALYRHAVAHPPRRATTAAEAVRVLGRRGVALALPEDVKRRLLRGGELRR